MSLDFSIIICTRHRPKHLAATLATVKEILLPANSALELVVVDNGPSQDTANVVEDFSRESTFDVVLENATVPGLSNARNAGIAIARGEVILFTDDDVRLPRNWLGEMTRPISMGEADIVAGRLVLPQSRTRPWLENIHRELLSISPNTISDFERQPTIIGGNFAFHKRVLENVCGFDERIGPGRFHGGGEDELFAWQAHNAGYRVVLCTTADVEHHFDESRFTRESFIQTAINRGRGNAWIMRQHYGRRVALPRTRANLLKCKLLGYRSLGRLRGGNLGPPSAKELRLCKSIAMFDALATEQDSAEV